MLFSAQGVASWENRGIRLCNCCLQTGIVTDCKGGSSVLGVFDRTPYLQIQRRSTRQSILETPEAISEHSSSMKLCVSDGITTIATTTVYLAVNRIVVVILAFCHVIFEAFVFVCIFLSLFYSDTFHFLMALPLQHRRAPRGVTAALSSSLVHSIPTPFLLPGVLQFCFCTVRTQEHFPF